MNYYFPNSRVAGTEFGSLNYDEIYKSILGENQVHPNYMIRVNPPEDVQYSLEYFVMIGMEDGFRAYILQYQTDEENYHTLASLQMFTGYFRILDQDRNIRASSYYKNGQLADKPEGSNQRANSDEYYNCDCVATVDKLSDIDLYDGTGSGFGSASVESLVITCTCFPYHSQNSTSPWDGEAGEIIYFDGTTSGGGSSTGGGSDPTQDGTEIDPRDRLGRKKPIITCDEDEILDFNLGCINEEEYFATLWQ